MDIFNTILGEDLAPFGPVILVGLLALGLIMAAVMILLGQKSDPLDKLNKDHRQAEKASRKSGKSGGLRTAKSNDKLEKYSTFLEPQNEKEYSAVHQKLLQAGYRSKDAVRFYHFAQFALGLGGLALGVAYFMLVLSGKEPTTQQTLMWILGLGVRAICCPNTG